MTSSPLVAALDPRVDEALVHEQMQQRPETRAETI